MFIDPARGLEQGRLAFHLQGRRLHGEFALVRFAGKRKEWLLLKKKIPMLTPAGSWNGL
ncbi:MAG: hypothetical protein ACXW6R_16040 [Candidatus Binatia bacterium]